MEKIRKNFENQKSRIQQDIKEFQNLRLEDNKIFKEIRKEIESNEFSKDRFEIFITVDKDTFKNLKL